MTRMDQAKYDRKRAQRAETLRRREVRREKYRGLR